MLKRIILIFVLVLIISVLPACSNLNPQAQPLGQKDEREFAQASLENYINYVLKEETVENFGFRDLKEAQTAVVGKPIKVYYIHLSALKEFEPGSSASRLFSENTKLYFPVLVDEVVRTKIEIIQIDQEWVAGEFGGIEPVQLIDKTYQLLPEILRELSAPETYEPVMVQIPAIEAILFFIQVDEREYFVTATIQPERFDLEDGQLYSAEEILKIFSEYTQDIEGDMFN